MAASPRVALKQKHPNTNSQAAEELPAKKGLYSEVGQEQQAKKALFEQGGEEAKENMAVSQGAMC